MFAYAPKIGDVRIIANLDINYKQISKKEATAAVGEPAEPYDTFFAGPSGDIWGMTGFNLRPSNLIRYLK